MGIQYVTVKVDTSGLYQPVTSAVGVVGIIGVAPSAGAGFNNPTLFTRALTRRWRRTFCARGSGSACQYRCRHPAD